MLRRLGWRTVGAGSNLPGGRLDTSSYPSPFGRRRGRNKQLGGGRTRVTVALNHECNSLRSRRSAGGDVPPCRQNRRESNHTSLASRERDRASAAPGTYCCDWPLPGRPGPADILERLSSAPQGAPPRGRARVGIDPDWLDAPAGPRVPRKFAPGSGLFGHP